jgi:acid phosphatase
MTRARQHRDLLCAAVAVLAFAVATKPVLAATQPCPPPVPDHIPPAPQGTLNVGSIKPLLRDYHQQYYASDVSAVFESAQKYVVQNAGQAKRPALILDIDETSLSNWPNLLADDFGFVADGPCDVLPAGPCGFNKWVLKGSAEAIEPARKLFDAAKANGVAVIFITGRPDQQRDITLINLDHAGYQGWAELRTRPDRDNFPTVQQYKAAERTKVEAEGYTIIANVGDQQSDIDGEYSGCRFKVPNPFYFIP